MRPLEYASDGNTKYLVKGESLVIKQALNVQIKRMI